MGKFSNGRSNRFVYTKTYFGCTNHPEFRSLCRRRVREAMAGKADGLHVDDHLGTAGATWWQGGGFCDWCMKAFRQYLKEHADEEQLQKASVSNIETFDYRELVRKYAKKGKGPVFDLLKHSLMGQRDQLDYGHLAARLSATEGAVRTMVHRLKQRYRQLLREHIAHTVATSEEVDLEMQHLRETPSYS